MHLPRKQGIASSNLAVGFMYFFSYISDHCYKNGPLQKNTKNVVEAPAISAVYLFGIEF